MSEPRSAGKRDRAASHESFAALVDASSNAARSDPRGGFDPAVPSRRMLERDVVRDSQPVSAGGAADRSRAPQRSDAPRADAADRRSGNDGRDSKADAPAASDDKPSRDATAADKAASDSDGAGTAKTDDSASQDPATPANQEAAAEAAKADSQAVIQTAVEAVPVVAVTAPTTTTATTPAGETVSAAIALAALQADAQQGEPQPALSADAAADQAATPAPHLAAMVAQATAAKTAIKTAAADKAAASDGAEQANAATEEAKPETASAAAGGATVLTDGAKGGEHKAEHKAAHHAAQNEAAAQGTAQADAPVAPRHHADANAAATANQLSATPDQVLTPAPQQLQPSSQLAANGMPTTQWTANVATNAAVPMNRLAIEIAATAQAGNSRFEIRLDPAELGRIDVRIEVDRHGNVTSHLTVEKPETLTMLRNDAPQLQRALDDAGLKTSDSGLQFSLRDQSSGQNQNSDDQQPRYHRLEIGEEEVPPAAVIGRNYGRMLGAAGGVDIRV
ncbi:flagellar hook-length control protein FliK [Rhodopseudomonas pseudopalustris]|uniref:flagellar hook-length control protein FliK n=1 Tax=Rhodopseudomonas pseudopalustris TaxID=1513892 RepID=UPI003F9476BB